jgi:peptide/nickel transport system ATP-binding protein
MLSLEGVSKVYRVGTFGGKELHAVRDVTFDVGDGEVVSLIGESGSGKTTIGKMILRLVSITGGSVIYNGMDVSTLEGEALKEYYRTVQGVFQDPFSTYNPIFKADRIFAMIRDEFYPEVRLADWATKVNACLEAVGLNPPDVLGKFPHQLSGGQLQRFLIARALLLETQFLVADEIISMLDASRRIDVLNLLADLKSRGLSILFITHDLSLAYYISDRAMILYRGRIVEMGATDKLYFNPMHPYTRMLMATVPRLDKKWEDVRVELRGQEVEVGAGCCYFERCPVSRRRTDCGTHRPPLIELDQDHVVACHCSEEFSTR